MKRIFILLFCLVTLLGNGKEIEPYYMSYSYPNSKNIYDPHAYDDYKYGVVYTKQLEIQEYILQRLDWLHLNIDKLANANKEDKNFIIILNSIKLLVIQLIVLMVCIFIMLVAMFYAIHQNNKLVKQRK